MQLVEDCEHREGRLTDWERTFIADTRAALEADKKLTTGQADKLDEIWDRVTSKDGRS